MVFDFAARPPEVNSTLIYSGAGAGPLMAAASSFSALSSELSTNAAAYESVIQELGSEWTGTSATAAAASAQQNIEWLQTTSAQLAEAAAKASASAAAYEAAFTASIPPPVVFANRAQLAALVATNILGQNTPAIAANEAMYGEFWAQDATAMSTYAANAATAAQVTPLTEPAQSTSPGGAGAQSAAVANAVNSNASNSGLNGILSSLQSTSSAAATPAASSAASGPLSSLYGAIQNFWGIGAVGDTVNTLDVTLSWCIMMLASAMGTLNHFVAGAPFGITIGDVQPLGAGLGFGTTLAGATSGGGGMVAGMGGAAEIGGMSVPAGWSAAAPAATASEATLAGSGWTSAVDEAATGAGGAPGIMPGMASAGGKSGMGIGGPRYGVKPKVMPKQVFV
ncbi:PPE family protein [Mycobacterium cookii]|uniref:PPE family protein PPE43 n=1 Tax=Mycobacterium cookii TaxID=1775 RepID=A0A7I7KX39_9MYCO|nr:PPE family protein [Mycobacterium cookii]MCV7331819.1 PPE family protein [Mycobacterium cookii]BBX46078.1 PPE family protein PPE43 [Mycobacterium cookii]